MQRHLKIIANKKLPDNYIAIRRIMSRDACTEYQYSNQSGRCVSGDQLQI